MFRQRSVVSVWCRICIFPFSSIWQDVNIVSSCIIIGTISLIYIFIKIYQKWAIDIFVYSPSLCHWFTKQLWVKNIRVRNEIILLLWLFHCGYLFVLSPYKNGCSHGIEISSFLSANIWDPSFGEILWFLTFMYTFYFSSFTFISFFIKIDLLNVILLHF